MTIDATKPFGSFPLTSSEARLISVCRAMPEGWFGKRLALLLRKLVKPAMARPVDIDVFGRRMRLDGRRNIAERRLLIQPQHFDPIERRILKNHLKAGDTAIDIGANVGAYTLFMAGLVGKAGRVIAIEPQPSVLARLKTNLEFNPELSVEIAETALGDHDGAVAFSLNPENEGESRIAGYGPAAAQITVPLTTLFGLLSARQVTSVQALKIDVEGAEPSVLLPFFNTAPRPLWPGLMILEQVNDRWTVDLVGSLTAKGYSALAKTKLNVILALG